MIKHLGSTLKPGKLLFSVLCGLILLIISSGYVMGEEPTSDNASKTGGSHILVACFSTTGHTMPLAEYAADILGADLFEIKPEKLYTDADLNWQNSKSRSSVEMNDRSCPPAIRSRVDNMEQYDVVFVGFPVWWYREPSIIDTFMEAYDFSGKTVVPFATSGMSAIGDSGKNMQEMAKGAKVVSGKRFSSSVSSEGLKSWASEWL